MNDTVDAPLTVNNFAAAARLIHPATRAMAHVRRTLLADPVMRLLVGDRVNELDDLPEGLVRPYVNLSAGFDPDDAEWLGLWTYSWGDSFSAADAIYTRVAQVMGTPAAGLWTGGEVDVYRPTIGEEHPPVAVVATFWTRAEYV